MTSTLIPPNEEQRKNIFRSCRLFGEEQLKKDVQSLREWVSHQPHLPADISDKVLECMITQNKNSMEKAKKNLDNYYSMKGQIPEFFDNQDPLDKEFQKSFDVVYCGVLSKMTAQGERISIGKMKDPDPEKFDPIQIMKRFAMIGDLRVQMESIEGGEIFFYDFEGVSMRHMTSITPVLGKHMIDSMRIFPSRFKCAVFFNAPAGLEAIIYVVKQLISEKLQKRIFVYSGGYENLYKHVPKEILPRDYGGDDKSLEEINEVWRKHLIDNRDWFIQNQKNRTIESKRPKENPYHPNQLHGIDGSFKKISFD